MTNINSQDKREKVIITSLSYIKKEENYSFKDYIILPGIEEQYKHSNEPVFAYLSKKLKDLENIKIVAFVSNEVLGNACTEQDSIKHDKYSFHSEYYLDQDNDKLSEKKEYKNTLDYYKQYLKKVFGYNTDNLITIPYNNEELNIGETIRILSDNLKSNTDLYIDISGGLRGYSTILMSLCDYFSYRSIEIKEIISCVSPTNKAPGRVISTDIEEILDFSEAISRFVNDGNANKLNERISNCSINDYSIIDNIKKYLTNFSNNILLIDLKEFDKHYKQLEMSLNAWEYLYNEKVNQNISVTDSCFYYSIKSIRTKLYMYEYSEDKIKDIEQYIKGIEQINLNANIANVEDEPSIRALNWCLDNNLIMQALSIYEEKIPQLYIKYRISSNIKNDLIDTLRSKFNIQVKQRIERGKTPEQIFYKYQDSAKAVYERLLKDFFKKNFFKNIAGQFKFDRSSRFNKIQLKRDIESQDKYKLLKLIDRHIHTDGFFLDNFLDDIEKMHRGICLSHKKIKDVCNEIVYNGDFLIEPSDPAKPKINTTCNIPILSSSFRDVVRISVDEYKKNGDINDFIFNKVTGDGQIIIPLWSVYQEIVYMRNQVVHSNSEYIRDFKVIKTKLNTAFKISLFILKSTGSTYIPDSDIIKSINDWTCSMNYSNSSHDLQSVYSDIKKDFNNLKNSDDSLFIQEKYDCIVGYIKEAFSLINDPTKDSWSRDQIKQIVNITSLSNELYAYVLNLSLDDAIKTKLLNDLNQLAK